MPRIQRYKLTCLSSITWLASNLIGKGVSNSDSNEFIGDNVPLVKTIDLVSCKSENAYKISIKIITYINSQVQIWELWKE